MAAPSKAEQEAEASARAQSGIDPGETAAATATIDDVGADPAPAQPQAADRSAEPAPPAPPPVKGQFDDKRAEIINRFRQSRTEEKEDQADEISEFARSGLPADFQEQPEPPEPEQVVAQPAPAAEAPKTLKVKVHGVETDMPIEEVIAKAQIAMAADNVLDEAKTKLRQVDELVEQARNKVTRTDPPGTNQTGENGAQNAEPASAAATDPANQGDPVDKLIETLQFGDPTEAAALLRKTIRDESGQQTRETLSQDRLRDEGIRTAKVLKDFEGKHADLAADPMARAAIETAVCKAQADDLTALGVDLKKINPRTPGVFTKDDIAYAHRWYRSQGYAVTAPDKLLEKATTDFLAWKGDGPAPQPKPADPAAGAQPTVTIEVDRSARRAAISPQPSRAAAPKPDASTKAAQPRDRSSIVQQMAARRAAPRGKVLAS